MIWNGETWTCRCEAVNMVLRKRCRFCNAERLGKFGHHPDPQIDAEVELDRLTGAIFDMQAGFPPPDDMLLRKTNDRY